MLNWNTLNSSALNSTSTFVSTLWSTDNIIFNGFSIMSLCAWTWNVWVNTINHRDLATVKLSTFDFPRINGWGITWKKYSNKTIQVTLTLVWQTNQEIEDLIDTLKKNLNKTEWILDMKFGNNRRVINATMTDMKFPNFSIRDVVVPEITITFESLDPLFRDKNAVNWDFLTITWDYTDAVINYWTEKVFPKIYLTFQPWIVWLSDVDITIGGYTLSINETINDNDLLIIDWQTKSVLLNWVDIDYDWIFAPIEVGQNLIEFAFTPSSTFTVDISVLWNNLYL